MKEPLMLEHSFLSSINTLFDAWTTAAVAERWLYQSTEMPTRFSADVKKGGRFHTEAAHDEAAHSHFGKYIIIERPHRLVFSLYVPDMFEGESEVEINIQRGNRGVAQLSFVQKNVDTSQNSAPWNNMFSRLEQLLLQPYLVTNESEVPQLVDAINITLVQISGFLLSLEDEAINKVPFKGSWTAAQLMRHVLKSLAGMGELFAKEVETATRNPREKVLPLKQAFLDITQKLESPGFIIPEEGLYDKNNLLQQLNASLYALNRNTKNIDEKGIITGLPFGDVTKLELLHFVLYHSQRHLIQMKKISDLLLA